jgi:hypothetical protein
LIHAVPLLAACLGLLLLSDLAHHPVLTLSLLGSAFLWLPYAARRIETHRFKTMGGRSEGAILLAALVLRLALLPLPLTLSDDALRYLWDGRVAMAGFNPYTLPPAATELTSLRDEMWRRLPHTEVPTVYPPLAMTAFSIATRLPFPLLAWKSLVTAADLGACALLLALARRRGIAPGRTVWYAWNPLVLLETAGMGHVDALGVAAMIGAVLCLTPRRAGDSPRPTAAAVWAAAGVLAKLAPAAALPLWSRRSGRPVRFLLVSLGLVAVAFLPVAAAARGVPPGLIRYGVSWEYNGPVFEPLWRLLDAAGAAPALARGVDHLKAWTRMWTAWNPVYPYLYPQLLAKALLAMGMIAAMLYSLRDSDPDSDLITGTGRLFGTLLLLSATVYPWYLLWLLPWAALARHTAWLTLSALILLSYLPKVAGVPLMPWVFLAIWVPFGLLMITSRWSRG